MASSMGELLAEVGRRHPHARRAPSAPRSERVRGCLLLGAVGDALGAEVEFDTLAAIRRRLGPDGVTGYDGGRGRITDDTQMALFTTEGLLRARGASDSERIASVRRALLRWLSTQGEPLPADAVDVADGWLVAQSSLHRRAAPGNTCLSALRNGGRGTLDAPINDSKGCGGVMRAAPCGLVGAHDPFTLGVDTAALTHGHPSGSLASGVLAATVAGVVDRDLSLLGALAEPLARLAEQPPRSDEVVQAVRAALAAAAAGEHGAGALERLGAGWVAEEALAMALWCAVVEPDPAAALLLAVNHSGDSDSTAAIAGNLVGALHGPGVVPAAWLDGLVERDLVAEVADDLLAAVPDPLRYPGA